MAKTTSLPIVAPQDDGFVRFPGVKKSTGLSRTTIWRMMNAGEFPKPRRIGKRAIAWLASDLVRWRAERPETLAGG